MIIKQALLRATKKLKQKQIKNPRLEAELLLSSILKKPREYILSHSDEELNFLKIINYKLKISRRIGGSPLAYLTHSKGFYGRDFYVNKNVLVPRPETELIIDEALKQEFNKKNIIIDVGTGSGCIIVSLIKEFQKRKFLISNFQFHAIDISKKALRVAKINSKIHNVNSLIKFHHGNLLEPTLKNFELQITNYKLQIFANLPYLTPSQVKNSPTIQKEPKIALEAGFDGLKYYRKLLKQVKELRIINNELKIIIYLEIDDTQKSSIQKLIKEMFPNSKCKIKTDLRGESRLAIIKV